MKWTLFLLAFSLFGSSCIRYKGYNKRDKNSPSAEACQPALTAYTNLIQPLVEERCIKCHSTGGTGALFATFEAGNAKWNMAVFSRLKNGDAEAIYQKASNQVAHAGGKQLNEDDQQKLKDFFTAVAQCQTPITGGPTASLCDGQTLPRRVTLLSRTEYKNTVRDITGVDVDVNIPAVTSVPDANKNPRLAFTNDQKSRSIDPNLAFSIKQAAATIATGFAAAKRQELGCTAEPLSDACLRNLAGKVFRRPIEADELTDLKTLGTFANTITYLFQTPDFLYRTELGNASSGDHMSPYEIASALAYLLTAMPPDAELLKLAADGTLIDGSTRRAQAERLMKSGAAVSQPIQQFFVEWLEIGRSEAAEKVGTYDGKAVFAESQAYLSKLLADDKTTLQTLFTQEENGRRGILQQRAFLASHSNNNSTSPVKLGKSVARNMLCLALPPPPANVNTELKDSANLKTGRAKLDAHVANPACASCHARIDPFGLAFEDFDPLGMGRTMDNGEAVNTQVEVKLGLSFDKTFANSNELIDSLSQSKELASCFDSFFQQYVYGGLSCEAQTLTEATSIREYILNLVSSDRFITRN